MQLATTIEIMPTNMLLDFPEEDAFGSICTRTTPQPRITRDTHCMLEMYFFRKVTLKMAAVSSFSWEHTWNTAASRLAVAM